jgi:hypothetical protein
MVDIGAAGREPRIGGKHRTEVTEVTEGGWGLVGERIFVDIGAAGRNRESGQNIARRPRGDGGWWAKLFFPPGTPPAWMRESGEEVAYTDQRRAAHRFLSPSEALAARLFTMTISNLPTPISTSVTSVRCRSPIGEYLVRKHASTNLCSRRDLRAMLFPGLANFLPENPGVHEPLFTH